MIFYLDLLSVFLRTERPILMSELLLTTSLPQSTSGLAGAQVCYRVRAMLVLNCDMVKSDCTTYCIKRVDNVLVQMGSQCLKEMQKKS
jgi:hypothetical protein